MKILYIKLGKQDSDKTIGAVFFGYTRISHPSKVMFNFFPGKMTLLNRHSMELHFTATRNKHHMVKLDMLNKID